MSRAVIEPVGAPWPWAGGERPPRSGRPGPGLRPLPETSGAVGLRRPGSGGLARYSERPTSAFARPVGRAGSLRPSPSAPCDAEVWAPPQGTNRDTTPRYRQACPRRPGPSRRSGHAWPSRAKGPSPSRAHSHLDATPQSKITDTWRSALRAHPWLRECYLRPAHGAAPKRQRHDSARPPDPPQQKPGGRAQHVAHTPRRSPQLQACHHTTCGGTLSLSLSKAGGHLSHQEPYAQPKKNTLTSHRDVATIPHPRRVQT